LLLPNKDCFGGVVPFQFFLERLFLPKPCPMFIIPDLDE